MITLYLLSVHVFKFKIILKLNINQIKNPFIHLYKIPKLKETKHRKNIHKIIELYIMITFFYFIKFVHCPQTSIVLKIVNRHDPPSLLGVFLVVLNCYWHMNSRKIGFFVLSLDYGSRGLNVKIITTSVFPFPPNFTPVHF